MKMIGTHSKIFENFPHSSTEKSSSESEDRIESEEEEEDDITAIYMCI